MNERRKWVLLVYRLPREPSTPRIALWRKFKRLGVAQLGDGLVALPLESEAREQLEWAGQEVLDAHGEATILIGEYGAARDERALVERMQRAIADEYRAVGTEARAAYRGEPEERARTLGRLRRELRRIRQRDYFPPSNRDEAEAAVERLAALVEVSA